LIGKIDIYVAENMQEHITVKYTNHYVRYILQNLIVQSQVNSLIMVLVTIFILLTIIFRSPVAGIFTATPVFIAILFNFAVMWLTGVTLNIGTSIIASVGMGVGIDYAIHYFTRFKAAFKHIPDHEKAVLTAIRGTGRAIIANALAVGTGFLVLLLSEYHIIVNVGWITALSMLTTAVSSLVVLPALIIIFKPKFVKSAKK
jgi:predicted RND superfamily exporter protein